MNISGKNIGFALTGSFCTFERAFQQMEQLVSLGANVLPIFSYSPQEMECRFGSYETFLKKAESIANNKPILTLAQAEPIGPKGMLDLLLIAPCTGNTLSKLSHAITDTPVLLAAKSHLRTEKPLVLSISSNDNLGLNFKNLGLLYSTKHIFFVPFGQDDPAKKPNSLVAHMDLIAPTIELALEEKQIQPVIRA